MLWTASVPWKSFVPGKSSGSVTKCTNCGVTVKDLRSPPFVAALRILQRKGDGGAVEGGVQQRKAGVGGAVVSTGIMKSVNDWELPTPASLEKLSRPSYTVKMPDTPIGPGGIDERRPGHQAARPVRLDDPAGARYQSEIEQTEGSHSGNREGERVAVGVAQPDRAATLAFVLLNTMKVVRNFPSAKLPLATCGRKYWRLSPRKGTLRSFDYDRKGGSFKAFGRCRPQGSPHMWIPESREPGKCSPSRAWEAPQVGIANRPYSNQRKRWGGEVAR